jgi:hypothetical protein
LIELYNYMARTGLSGATLSALIEYFV